MHCGPPRSHQAVSAKRNKLASSLRSHQQLPLQKLNCGTRTLRQPDRLTSLRVFRDKRTPEVWRIQYRDDLKHATPSSNSRVPLFLPTCGSLARVSSERRGIILLECIDGEGLSLTTGNPCLGLIRHLATRHPALHVCFPFRSKEARRLITTAAEFGGKPAALQAPT
ncbi:hypothetical protein SRHO_G00255460 [Serrasalmus rhombeus]